MTNPLNGEKVTLCMLLNVKCTYLVVTPSQLLTFLIFQLPFHYYGIHNNWQFIT